MSESSNPLVATFIVSWCLTNYRFFVILLSDESVTMTFKMIDEHFSGWMAWVNGLAIPITVTAVYLFVLPLVSGFVYQHWLNVQANLRALKLNSQKKELISVEVKQELEEKMHEESMKHLSERKQLNDEIVYLKDTIAQLSAENNDLKRTRERLINKGREQSKKEDKNKLSESEERILVEIANNDDRQVTKKVLMDDLGEESLDVDHYIDRLTMKNYIAASGNVDRQHFYALTSSGRNYVVENELRKKYKYLTTPP